MITFLKGVLVESLPNRAAIDVNGVGYEVLIPLSSYDRLPEVGKPVQILTHLHIRENEHTLFGFGTAEERDLFRLLIGRVSGVGPKVAMSVLGGMGVMAFKACVVNGDLTAIAKIKGLGKKTAERIVLELKDKVGVAAAWEAAGQEDEASVTMNDAVLALITLGYKQVEAHKAVKAASTAEGAQASSDDLVRAALRMLN
ncbi:MAG: Holliday junction DNA helicase RuvA [Verrucomicrobiales bacterium]|jgi:Holliday junction DNA helicase RuvA